MMPSLRDRLCWCLGAGARPDITYNAAAAADNGGLELTTMDVGAQPMPTDDAELDAKFATIVVS